MLMKLNRKITRNEYKAVVCAKEMIGAFSHWKKMEAFEGLERETEELREYYRTGKTKEASWRRAQLKGLLKLVMDNQEDIFKALDQDLGKHHVEAFRDEVGTLIKSLNYALKSFKEWMSGTKAKLPMIALLTTAEIIPEPLGLVLVISSWNFPFGLSLEPVIGALAAGNCVVLKPSELAPASSALLAKTIPSYVDNKAVKVIQGGPEVGHQFLQQKWDKIFFTGSPRVGRLVITAAAKHLTPVTLELGGKCPAILDSLSSSWDTQAAIKRIVVGKFGTCAGQACIGIDYVLAEKKFIPNLLEKMKVIIKNMHGEDPKRSNTMARIVNKEHFSRLKNLIKDPTVRDLIVHGGSMDEDELFIEPTILLDPPLDSDIMREEIFGPLLPIISLEKLEESIEFINSRPKPLAIYAFTKDTAFQKRLTSETSSGSLIFNDTIVQYAADTLPFGGIGGSGIGRYHGKFSFETFSHEKVVVRRSFLSDFWFRYPPWNNYKFQLLKDAYNYDYLAMFLVITGLRRT